MGWKKLVGCVFLLGMGSCFIIENAYYKENGPILPKRPRFALAKEPYRLREGDLIDTNSVYVESYTVTYPDSIQKREAFIRFFSNGRCFSGVTKDFRRGYVVLDDVNDINRGGGTVAYFKLENHSQLTMESFWVRELVGRYVKEYGYIRNDSIFLFEHPYKKSGFPIPNENNCRIYVRRKIEGLTGAPDW